MEKKTLSRTAKYYQKVPLSKRHCGNIDIKELIDHYRQYECLWNYNNKEYKNRLRKDRAWTQIAHYFDKDPNEVKRKIKSLRTAYVAEKRKVDASKREGIEPIYKPILFYYKYLTFLDSVVICRKAQPSDTSQIGQQNETTQFESVEVCQQAEEDETSYFPKTEEIELDIPQDHEYSPEPSPINSPRLSPPPRQKPAPKMVFARSFSARPPVKNEQKYKKFKPNKTVNSNRTSSSGILCANTIYSSFGKTIALQLQQLPLDVATETMSEIHNKLTKKILEYIRSRNEDQSMEYSDEDEESVDDILQAAIDDADI